MSLHAAAQHLANKGRGTDTTLVHMSPREVQGLQALAKAQGGSLSVNPKTGLVEAGFLEQALPIVAAAAATYFTAGAAAPALSAALGSTMAGGILAGAGAGALIGGGTAAIQGKDAGQAALYGGIGGAISGGLGAYTPAPTEGVTQAATQQAATQAGSQAIGGAATTPATTGIDPAILEGMSKEQVLSQVTPQAVSPQQLSQGVSQGVYTPQQAAQYGQAYSGVYNQPTPGSDFYATSNPLTKAGILSLPGIGTAVGEKYQPPGAEQYDPNNPARWRLSNNFQAPPPVQPNPYYSANYSGYAAGGLADLQGNMYPQSQQDTTQFAVPSQMPTSAEVVRSDYDPMTQPYTGQPMMMAGGGMPADQKKKKAAFTAASKLAAMDPYEAAVAGLGNAMYGSQMPGDTAAGLGSKTQLGQLNLATGGISNLGGYSDGGRMLKGRGDGMSDSIPASIAGKQPARLADGEFVVPADVVSHLGNGSTDAGAKRLYSMMDKVRHARTGKKSQGKQINPNKFMPA